MTTETLKFCCPKCAHDRVQAVVGQGSMRCRKCGFTAVRASFKVEPRPSLKWDEAIVVQPDNFG